MAAKLGIFDQLLFGKWADRHAINRNAEDLSTVETDLTTLRASVQRQSQEILQLRAMLMGVVEVLHEKAPFDDADLERAVQSAWTKLVPPPPTKPGNEHPYRGTLAGEPPVDSPAAKALLAVATDHHFSKRFQEARATYAQVIEQYGETKQAAMARQQLENLRNA